MWIAGQPDRRPQLEGDGVAPDVTTPQDAAPDKAQALALETRWADGNASRYRRVDITR